MSQTPVAVNDDPVNGGLTTNEDTPFTTIDVRWNDSDPDGDPLTVIDVEGALVGEDYILPGSGAIVRLNADGTIYYDTNNQLDGLGAGDIYYDSFSYTLSDGESTSAATVTVAVEGLEEDGGGGGGNNAPTAFDDEPSMGGLTTNEDTPFFTIALQLNDTDPEDDLLTVQSVNGAGVGQTVALASGALITLQADGTVYYNTNNVFDFLNGVDIFYDNFTYTVSDGVNISGATVTVAVEGITDEPGGPTQGNDTLIGSNNNDTISGLGGYDRIYGRNGNDTLSGGEGADYIRGEGNDDVLSGDAGNDHLLGDDGNDALKGGDGTDKLYGGDDNDMLYGGNGVDRLFGESNNDKLYGDAGNDTLSGGDGVDFIRGGTENDTLNGDAGNDHLIGDAGNDLLLGGDGADKLYGSAGNDTVTGGLGADRLWGDAGADRFVFAAGDSAPGARDTIEHYEDGIDVIDLSATGYTALQVGIPVGNPDVLGYIIVGNDAFIASEDNSFVLTIRGAPGFDETDVII